MNIKEIQNGITYLKKNDPILGKIITKVGSCTLKPHRNYFNALLESIIGQQLSILAAASIERKFMHYFNNLPEPLLIIETNDEILRGLGLSNAKVKYVKDLAVKILNGDLVLNKFTKKTDEQIIEDLIKVKGIGEWTAHMFLIFTLGRPNVLPTGDLGIKRAISINYNFEEYPTPQQIVTLSIKNKWAPYNTLASWYLWKSLEK